MEELNSFSNIDQFQFESDPLLKAGAFIDPNSNSISTADPVVVVDSPSPPIPDQMGGGATSNGKSKGGGGGAAPSYKRVLLPESENPDWLPLKWRVEERIRLSGASAGSRDKYYKEPATGKSFRSKKEVLYYVETGTKKRKNTDDAESSPQTDSAASKRKKSESKAKVSVKNFNFDDVPAKVKWELTNIYEGIWRPLTNGVDRVPESAKQEWSAAFTYLTMQNGSGPSLG